jgi:hypothetical protein
LGRLAAFPQVHRANSSLARKKGPQLTLEAFRFGAVSLPLNQQSDKALA